MKTIEELTAIASQVRRDIIRMVTTAKSGHPGGSLSSTDILTALYFSEMKQDPAGTPSGRTPSSLPPATWLPSIMRYSPAPVISSPPSSALSANSEPTSRGIRP